MENIYSTPGVVTENGKEEVDYLINGYGPVSCEKYRLAQNLIRLIERLIMNIRGCIEKCGSIDKCACIEDMEEIEKFLKDNPMIKYYFVFVNLIRGSIGENIINSDDIYDLGVKLVHKEHHSELVKLGITLISVVNKNKAMEYGKVLGLNGKYTFYVVNGTVGVEGYNSFILNLAKNTRTYGKFLCLSKIEPLDEDTMEWIVEEGWHNEILEEESGATVIEKIDLMRYMEKCPMDNRRFQCISELLRVLITSRGVDLEDIYNGEKIINLYIDCAQTLAVTLEDLRTLYLIMVAIEDQEESDLWNKVEKKRLKDKTEKIIGNKKWIKILKDGLRNGLYDVEFYCRVAILLGLDLEYDDFEKFIEKNPLNIDIYYYLGMNRNKKDMEKLITLAKRVLITKNIECSDRMDEYSDIDEVETKNMCLLYLVRNLKNYDIEEIEIPILALQATMIRCRAEALSYLKRKKLLKHEKVQGALKDALKEENNEEIRDRILKAMQDIDNNIEKKESVYVEIENLRVIPNIKDTYLVSLNVAGVYYRNMEIIEDNLKAMDVVFLKREYNNSYDENAIQVVNKSGYVLGYIPRKDNYILKNLMEDKKKLYGIIEDVNLDENLIRIDVYLSYDDVIDAVKEIMSMITTQGSIIKN